MVHSEDFTVHGSADEAEDFISWLCDLDYRHKLFTCSNHDFCMYRATVSGLGDTVHSADSACLTTERCHVHALSDTDADTPRTVVRQVFTCGRLLQAKLSPGRESSVKL